MADGDYDDVGSSGDVNARGGCDNDSDGGGNDGDNGDDEMASMVIMVVMISHKIFEGQLHYLGTNNIPEI